MNPPIPSSTTPSARQAIVLDTNVVLDWLVFHNPSCTALATAITAGHLRWLVTEAMRDELAHVLGRGVVSAWAPDESRLWATWERLAETVAEPGPAPRSRHLHCTDSDDQKFIDLALDSAQWLVSRDKAVLKLARRAAPLGLRILTPERWLHAP